MNNINYRLEARYTLPGKYFGVDTPINRIFVIYFCEIKTKFTAHIYM